MELAGARDAQLQEETAVCKSLGLERNSESREGQGVGRRELTITPPPSLALIP